MGDSDGYKMPYSNPNFLVGRNYQPQQHRRRSSYQDSYEPFSSHNQPPHQRKSSFHNTSNPLTPLKTANADPFSTYNFSNSQVFDDSPIQDSPLGYQNTFGLESSSRYQQSFQPFQANLLYNISQSQNSSGYLPSQQESSRQSNNDLLSNQFGLSSYYNGSSVSQPTTPLGSSHGLSSFSSGNYTSYRRPRTSSLPFGATMGEYSSLNVADVLEQPEPDPSETEDVYGSYNQLLRQTFETIRDGRVAEAGLNLTELSNWLISKVTDLGLTRDSQDLYASRITLWDSFNKAWLATLQRQKENTESMLASGQPLQPPQTILDASYLYTMGQDIVSWGDTLEKFGLVDYQMGLWEEEILDILEACLDLLEDNIDDEDDEELEGMVSTAVKFEGPSPVAVEA